MKKNQGLEGIDPAQVREVLRRMDILKISKQYGFIPIGGPGAFFYEGGGLPSPYYPIEGCHELKMGQAPE
jgi:hypothetical protein